MEYENEIDVKNIMNKNLKEELVSQVDSLENALSIHEKDMNEMNIKYQSDFDKEHNETLLLQEQYDNELRNLKAELEMERLSLLQPLAQAEGVEAEMDVMRKGHTKSDETEKIDLMTQIDALKSELSEAKILVDSKAVDDVKSDLGIVDVNDIGEGASKVGDVKEGGAGKANKKKKKKGNANSNAKTTTVAIDSFKITDDTPIVEYPDLRVDLDSQVDEKMLNSLNDEILLSKENLSSENLSKEVDVLRIKDLENEIYIYNKEICVLKEKLSEGYDTNEKYKMDLNNLENEMKLNREETNNVSMINEEKIKEHLALSSEKIKLIEILENKINLFENEKENANDLISSYEKQLEVAMKDIDGAIYEKNNAIDGLSRAENISIGLQDKIGIAGTYMRIYMFIYIFTFLYT